MKLTITGGNQALAVGGALNSLREGMKTDMELYLEYGEKTIKKELKHIRKLENKILMKTHTIRINDHDKAILIRALEDDQDRAFVDDNIYYKENVNKYITPLLNILKGGEN